MPGRITMVIALCAAALASAPGWCEPEGTARQPAQNAPQEEQGEAEDHGPGAAQVEDKDGNERVEDVQEEPATPAEAFGKAEKELEAGHVGGAYSLFERLCRQNKDQDIAARAAEQLKQIEARGEQEVKDALAADDPNEAARRLNEVYRNYRATPVRQLVAQAREWLRVRMAQRAIPRPDEDEADEAEGEGEDDATAAPEEEDKAARMLLIVGDIHLLNGRGDKARTTYYDLIYEYPESRFAEQARDRLEQLRIDEAAEEPGGEE